MLAHTCSHRAMFFHSEYRDISKNWNGDSLCKWKEVNIEYIAMMNEWNLIVCSYGIVHGGIISHNRHSTIILFEMHTFIYSFLKCIHLFKWCYISTFYLPGYVLGIWNTSVNQDRKNSCPSGACLLWGCGEGWQY